MARVRKRFDRARTALALLVVALALAGLATRAPGAAAQLTWSPAGTLASGRLHATATLLQDGRVLVVGGLKGGPYSNTDTAELFDAATKSWTPTGKLISPRAGHAATMLPDGSVLVAGGSAPVCCGGIAGAERFDPAKKSWAAVASMGTPREFHTATLLNNGKVLVVGGFTGGGSPARPIITHASAEIYDPIANSWSPAAALGAPRSGHTATRLADGTVLVTGGSNNGGTLATAERYDPATNAWSPAGTLAAPRSGHTATALQDGRVLVVGGTDELGGATTAERYDPATNGWSPAGTLAGPRSGHTATLTTTGEVLVAGGNGTGGFLATTERYDPAKNSWTAGSSMAAPRANHVAALVNGTVLVAGGWSADSPALASAEIYNDAPPGTCFAQTGHCVHGRFLDYWQAHGGLAINGYPLSEIFAERLEDGKVYQVQYFERTRLEWHPEVADPRYQVLLGQFGRRIRAAEPPAAPLQGARYFPETGHNVVGNFRAYWEANGGLDQFGFPLTEEFTEVLEDGKPYQVQYFERARFERHPENAAPYDVLLGQFGRRILAGR